MFVTVCGKLMRDFLRGGEKRCISNFVQLRFALDFPVELKTFAIRVGSSRMV